VLKRAGHEWCGSPAGRCGTSWRRSRSD